MRLYEPPAKEFFRLPNSIFHAHVTTSAQKEAAQTMGNILSL